MAERWLAVDWGRRHIGLAVGPPSLAVESVAAGDEGPQRVLDAARGYDATGIVVGLPINMDGSEGKSAKDARAFADTLRDKGFEIALYDERLTSWEAEGRLISDGVKPSKRRAKVHSVAAQVLLDAFLAARRDSSPFDRGS